MFREQQETRSFMEIQGIEVNLCKSVLPAWHSRSQFEQPETPRRGVLAPELLDQNVELKLCAKNFRLKNLS